MSVAGMARALGVPSSRISEWKKRGMPMDSVEAARTWREEYAPARKQSDKPRMIREITVEYLVPDKERRNVVDGIDDQGEAEGDKASNPYDRLRQAKQAEEVAWKKIEAMNSAGLNTDATEFAGYMRTFSSAQKHTAFMQKQAEEWARRMGATLYTDEAIIIYGSALQTILQQVDLMAGKISPLCTDVERARDAIEEYCQKLRQSAEEAIKSHASNPGSN